MKMRSIAHEFVEVKDGFERWKYPSGKYKTAEVWRVIRPKNEKVTCYKLVWLLLMCQSTLSYSG